MSNNVTLDTSRFTAASAALAALAKGKTNGEILERHARSFVKRVVSLTPPANGSTAGVAAKRQGEKAIDRDLGRIFVPVDLKGKRKEQFPDVEGIYEREVGSRKGRTKIQARRDKYHVDRRKLEKLRRKLYKLVGWLAGGWNAAAQAVGYTMPGYAKRHGAGAGQARVELSGPTPQITLTNEVKFNRQVRDYERRVQTALDYEAKSLERQLDAALTKQARKAGFQVRG